MHNILMSGVGYPSHSVKLDTIIWYAWLTAKHPSNDKGHPNWDWVPPTLSQTQHYNVLCATCYKTSEHQRKVIHTRIGYPPHSVKLNIVTCYVRLTSKHLSNDEGHPHWGWISSTLGQTQYCNVLRATYLKTFEQWQRITHTGIGYPPHSVKLHTVMRYVWLTKKHPSNNRRSSKWGLGNPPSVQLSTISGHVWRAPYLPKYFRCNFWSHGLWRPFSREPLVKKPFVLPCGKTTWGVVKWVRVVKIEGGNSNVRCTHLSCGERRFATARGAWTGVHQFDVAKQRIFMVKQVPFLVLPLAQVLPHGKNAFLPFFGGWTQQRDKNTTQFYHFPVGFTMVNGRVVKPSGNGWWDLSAGTEMPCGNAATPCIACCHTALGVARCCALVGEVGGGGGGRPPSARKLWGC